MLPIARQNANHFVPLLPDLDFLDEPDARMSKQISTPPIIADAAIVDLKDALHKQGIRIDLEASRALPPGEQQIFFNTLYKHLQTLHNLCNTFPVNTPAIFKKRLEIVRFASQLSLIHI